MDPGPRGVRRAPAAPRAAAAAAAAAAWLLSVCCTAASADGTLSPLAGTRGPVTWCVPPSLGGADGNQQPILGASLRRSISTPEI